MEHFEFRLIPNKNVNLISFLSQITSFEPRHVSVSQSLQLVLLPPVVKGYYCRVRFRFLNVSCPSSAHQIIYMATGRAN